MGFGGEDEEAAAVRELTDLLRCVHLALEEGSNVDLLHNFLGMVLLVHADAIAKSAELRAIADGIRALVQRRWAGFSGVLQDVRCMIDLIQGTF